MLGELVSGDEEVIVGGAGLKGKEDIDEALSGIKLYKARIRLLLLLYSLFYRDLRGLNDFFVTNNRAKHFSSLQSAGNFYRISFTMKKKYVGTDVS